VTNTINPNGLWKPSVKRKIFEPKYISMNDVVKKNLAYCGEGKEYLIDNAKDE